MRPSYKEVSIQLDKFFFSPLSNSETLESRAETIEIWLKNNNWNWDQIIEEISKPENNFN